MSLAICECGQEDGDDSNKLTQSGWFKTIRRTSPAGIPPTRTVEKRDGKTDTKKAPKPAKK